MKKRFTASSGILLLVLSGCAAQPAEPASPQASSDDDHGEIAGATELAEPALHLATVDDTGVVQHLDLLDESVEELTRIAPVDEVVTNGRYLFAIREGSVTVIDSGVWTRSHGDHFHYYQAEERVIGEVTGRGIATVTPGESGIGILFDGEAVLLDTLAVADGELTEQFRIAVEPHEGVVVPLDAGAVVTEPDAAGVAQSVRVLGQDGTAGERIDCAQAAGSITTAVGVVIGCADGAVLSVDGEPDSWERIAYPEGDVPAANAPAAAAFDARKGRPSVAALAGGSGVWILDTRERSWTLHDIGVDIVRAVAVDDAQERVLLLASDGSVLVLAGGQITARTAPLVAASLNDPATAAHVSFVVDHNRAYLNGPLEQTLWEIDPADDARISRVFATELPPLHLAGTGR